jgi:hypothetical protein
MVFSPEVEILLLGEFVCPFRTCDEAAVEKVVKSTPCIILSRYLKIASVMLEDFLSATLFHQLLIKHFYCKSARVSNRVQS